MKINIYNYLDYIQYCNLYIRSMQNNGIGIKSRLSKSTTCDQKIISEVLNYKYNFTLEQAIKVSKFFKHNLNQEKYFIGMVQFARAKDNSLKEHFRNILNELRYENIAYDVNEDGRACKEVEQKTCGNWYYIAVYTLLRIDKFRKNIELLSSSLGINIKTLKTVLKFLIRKSMVIEVGSEYRVVGDYVIPDGNNIQNLHRNWISKALQKISKNESIIGTEMHSEHDSIVVSAPFSLSRRADEILSQTIINKLGIIIELMEKDIREGKLEVAKVINIDYLQIK